MKTYLDCVPCVMRQALESVRQIPKFDKETAEKVLKEVATYIEKADFNNDPAVFTSRVHQIVQKLSGVKDPLKKQRDISNKIARKLLGATREKVKSADDSLFMAMKAAISGNALDFGVYSADKVKNNISELIQRELAINDYESVLQFLAGLNQLLYLADNAGEIWFDRLLIEELKERYPKSKIFLAVKRSPVLDDAVEKDAIKAGINEMDEVEVITTGSNDVGVNLDKISSNFRNRLNKASLIISKGQANFESLEGKGTLLQTPVLFLLQAKCSTVADYLGVPKGGLILKLQD